jgi:hypothetical protein
MKFACLLFSTAALAVAAAQHHLPQSLGGAEYPASTPLLVRLVQQAASRRIEDGGMAEWLKAAVLKTSFAIPASARK